jgi:hypothetical protein
MRKFGVFSLFLFYTIVIAGLYGALHDQITYSISPEYFTKFKYQQFGFEPNWFGGHRQTVAIIGFLATWWTGMLIGVVLGLVAFIFPDYKAMGSALRRAIVVVIAFSAGFAVLGGLYGRLHLAKTGVSWWLPGDLSDRTGFITVGSIHNFSYIGGLFGLLVGIFILIRLHRQTKRMAVIVKVDS